MSVTNGERLVTKQDLADMYQGILPYLGGMPEILASKFGKGDMYSTDEKMIGQWINGKPLYQRYLTFSSRPLNVNVDNINAVTTLYSKTYNSPTAVKVNEIRCTTDTGSNEGYIAFKKNSEEVARYYLTTGQETYYTGGDVTIGCDTNDTFSVVAGWIRTHSNCDFAYKSSLAEFETPVPFDYFFEKVPGIINYTKLNDSAISIGDDTDYSTDEKVVGTWIDGKPVYQIVIPLSSDISSGKIATVLDATEALNIDTLVGGTGIGYIYDGNSSPMGQMLINGYFEASTYYSFSSAIKMNSTGTKVILSTNVTGTGYTLRNVKIILQYTKTT